jgi:hypothetical protein
MRQGLGRRTVAWAALVLAGVMAAAAAAAAPAPSPAPGPAPSPGRRPAPPSPAPAPAPGAEAVSVTILGIRATKEDKPHIDPGLQSVAEKLRSGKYNSFRLAVSDTRSVPLGGVMEVAMVEDYILRVQILKVADDSVQIDLAWLRVEKDAQGKPRIRTVQPMKMTLRKGKYMLSGGWELQEGATLWGAVAVR